MNRKVSILFIIGLIFLVISGCEIDSKPFTTGSFTLTINSENTGRTILPDVGGSIASYRIEIKDETPAVIYTSLITGTSESIDLPTGTYNITVYGIDTIDGTGDVVAIGSVSVTITAGTAAGAVVSLFPLEAGTGAINVTVDWSAVNSITVIINVSATLDGGPIGLSTLSTSANYTAADISFGSHMLIFYLEYGDSLTMAVAEAVQVFENLTSSDTIDLNDVDFSSLPPSTPTGLIAVESSGQIDLSWTDTSNIETGYVIERSVTNNTSYVVLANLAAGTVSYSDTGVTAGTTYYYRVKAVNSNGPSDYSNEQSIIYGELLTLSITVTEPSNETITLGGNITVSQSSTLTITVSDDTFNSYAWYLDGVVVIDETPGTPNIIDYGCSGTSLGVHHLTVFVTRGSKLYSNTIRFTVTN